MVGGLSGLLRSVSRDHASNTILAIMITITSWFLWEAGEGRVDAYISLYTLEYLVIKAIARPRRIYRDWLALILIAIFILIVGYRVYEVIL